MMDDAEIIDIVIIGEDGRVTIPSKIRETLKLTKGSRVMWTLEKKEERAFIKKV